MILSIGPTPTIAEPAMQRCPAQPDILAAIPAAVNVILASGKTIIWFFAPPKATQRFRLLVARRYTILATLVEPTNETAWISGWSQIASTISWPPFTTLKTPAGKPASVSNSAMRFAEIGTFSEGLRIMQFPKAMAFG